MCGHGLLAQQVGECARHPFGQPAGVDEDQRRAVLGNQFSQAFVDLAPGVERHHRLERRAGNFDGEIALALMAGIDDLTFAVADADQEMRDGLDRLDGGREADADQTIAAQRRQALQRHGEMGAALVAGDGVDLVDDDAAGGGQHLAAGLGAEQHVEQLRRGDDDVRRLAPHALALRRGRVAGADDRSDFNVGQATLAQRFANPGQRKLEVLVDVVGEGLERRDVHDLRLVRQRAGDALAHEVVDRRHERGQRLAGAGRRRDQDVAPGLDRRPGFRLRCGRRCERALEPRVHRLMEQRLFDLCQHRVNTDGRLWPGIGTLPEYGWEGGAFNANSRDIGETPVNRWPRGLAPALKRGVSQMPLGLIAFAAACAFVGIGLYINIAEQPARLGLAPSAMMKEWTPSNRRGFILLTALALLAAIFGVR